MNEHSFEHFFKPEIRKAGDDLVATDAVYLRLGSDRQIDASVRASTPLRVAFRSASIESPEFTVDCTCSSSRRGQFCRHIWATLIVGLKKSPDFFDSKTTIGKSDELGSNQVKTDPAKAAQQAAYKEAQGERQREYAKAQRTRAKEYKAGRAAPASGSNTASNTASNTGSKSQSKSQASRHTQAPPDDVQDALTYFEQNGFPLTLPIDAAALGNAKRVLSRVFHPDKGGTQAEIIELNRHVDVLQAHQ